MNTDKAMAGPARSVERTGGSVRAPRGRWGAAGLALLGLAAGGCQSSPVALPDVGPVRAVANVGGVAAWPREVRRVLVLPVHDVSGRHPASFARQFDADWLGVLQRSQRAEFVPVSRAALAGLTGGRESLDAADMLPPEFLQRLAAAHGAEAVIFFDLNPVRPTPPLAMGLRLRLVTLPAGESLWAADEMFDAAEDATARRMRWSARAEAHGPGDPTFGVAQSPTIYVRTFAELLVDRLPPLRAPRRKAPVAVVKDPAFGRAG